MIGGRERPWDEPRLPLTGARKRSTWHGWPTIGGYGSVASPMTNEAGIIAGKVGVAEAEDEVKQCSTVRQLRNLKRHYGFNLMLLIFNVQHVMKGFVVNSTAVAEQYVYKSYYTPATEMQMFNAVTSLPWSMKPVIGLVSDIFPIFGFNKAPYALITSVAGTAAFLVIGLLHQSSLPETALVGCLFLCSLQVSTADVLTQGKITARVKDAPTSSLRTGLLAFTWSGSDACALIAVISSGFLINYFGPRLTYLVACVPGATFIFLTARGCYEEKCISKDLLHEVRMRFYQQVEACMLSLLMFAGALTIICSLTSSQQPIVHGIVAGSVGITVLISFSMWLTPTVAKMSAFNFIYAIMSVSTDAAAFYFFTDSVEQYPQGPHLSVFFFTTVRGAVQFGFSFIGVYSYQTLSEGWTYRRWLIMSTFLFALVNILNIMMFKRVNIQLGVSDEFWVIGTTAIVSVVDRWKWMPRVVSISFMTPRGMEATFTALLMGCNNLGWAISAIMGGMLLRVLGVSPSGAPRESAQFENLWIASAWSSVVPPVVMLLLCWLAPDEQQDVSLVGDARDAATAGSLWRRLRGDRAQPALRSVFTVPRRRTMGELPLHFGANAPLGPEAAPLASREAT